MPTGSVLLAWRGGEHVFCVGQVKSVLALEEASGAGIFAIAGRVESSLAVAAAGQLGGQAGLNDVREVIRLGLIGGGMAADDAMKLIKLHVDGAPLVESLTLSYAVLAAYLRGVPGDKVGKGEADRTAEA